MNRDINTARSFFDSGPFILTSGILLMALLTFFSRHIPFFWDTVFFAEGASYFKEHGAGKLALPSSIDSGGFPLYALWMYFGWTLFGKSLAVSHWLMFPFLAGILVEFYRLAKRLLEPRMVKWAVLLLFLEPTFITQSILMGYDLMMLFFFLLALNGMLSGNRWLSTLAMTLLVMSSVRGIISLAALGIIHFMIVFLLKEKLYSRAGILIYFFPLLAWMGWAAWHYYLSGWFFFSPEREATHESFAVLPMIWRQFLYGIWKSLDFGRIILVLILLAGLSIALRQSLITREFKKVILYFLAPLGLLILFMSFFSNPIGHRYFMPALIILPVAALYGIQIFKNSIWKPIMIIVASLALISGNFWLYPERFGNGWDSSMKVLPWFRMEKEIHVYIEDNQINPRETGTLWPVYRDMTFILPGSKYVSFSDMTNRDPGEFQYVLQTNVCNYFTAQTLGELRNTWAVRRKWKCGQVYAVLYENPDKPADEQ